MTYAEAKEIIIEEMKRQGHKNASAAEIMRFCVQYYNKHSMQLRLAMVGAPFVTSIVDAAIHILKNVDKHRIEKSDYKDSVYMSAMEGDNVDMGTIMTKYESEWDSVVEILLNKSMEPQVDGDGKEIESKIHKITDYDLKENKCIKIPSKMDLFEGLDITIKDKVLLNLENGPEVYPTVLLVNGDDNAIGFFEIETVFDDGEEKDFLVTESDNIIFENHKSTKYYFVFCSYTYNRKLGELYKVPVEVEYHELEETDTHLCIDFGTLVLCQDLVQHKMRNFNYFQLTNSASLATLAL